MRNAGRCRSLAKKMRRRLLSIGIGLWVIVAAICAEADENTSEVAAGPTKTVVKTEAGSDDSGAPAVEMEKTVIIGSRTATEQPADLSVPVQVITGAQLQEIGAISLQQALEVIQGVELVQSPDLNASPGVQTLRMRGMDANHVLVLIDGRRQPGSRPDAQGFSYTDISSISIDNIERIEVLRDGASAQYGSDAVAGVINIVLRKNNPRFSVNSQYGLSSRGDGEEMHLDVSGGAPIGSKLFVNASASGKKIEHYDRTPDNPRWSSPDIEQANANIKLSWDINYRQVLDTDVRVNRTETVLRKGASGDVDQDRISETTDLYGGLNWEGDFSPVTYTVGGGVSTTDNDYRHSEDPDYNGDLDAFMTDVYAHADYVITPWLSLFAGGSYNREDVDSPQREFVEDRDVAAVFAELQLEFFERLSLQLSGRLENYSDFDTHFAPKLSGRYELVAELALRASVASSYQAPTLFQLHDRFIGAMGWNDIYGNPDLEPAEGISMNAGLVWKPFRQRGIQLTLDYFQNRIDNMIETELISSKTADSNAVTTYVNLAGTSTFEGVEAEMILPLAYGFGLNVSANYLEAADPDGEDLANRPRCGLNATLTYQYGERLQANLRYNYRGKYLDDQEPHNKIDAFDYFNAHVTCGVTKHVSIYLGARNLFDEEPPVDPADYESGHMESMIDSVEGAYYYGGLRLKF